MDIDGIKSNLHIEDLVFASCRGGWPASLNKENTEEQLSFAQNYIENICNYSISEIDGVKRNPQLAKSIIKAHARNISKETNQKTILENIKKEFPKLAYTTYKTYLNTLIDLSLIGYIYGWDPNIRPSNVIRKKPKLRFIDPSIIHAVLNLSPELLLKDMKTFALVFENLCIRDLNLYLNETGAKISYYKDDNGLEADAVIHLKNGDYSLIKFNISSYRMDYSAKNLIKLKKLIMKNIKEKNLKIGEPKFLAVITGEKYAYTREDGVKVLLIGCLR